MSWIWDNLLSKKKERVLLVICLSLVIIVLAAKFFVSYFFTPYYPDLNEDLFAEVITLEKKYKSEKEERKKTYDAKYKQKKTKNQKFPIANSKSKVSSSSPSSKPIKPILFNFDPNTITKDSMLLLGISTYAANNLVRYREKGGKIYSKDKFKSIYGIDENTFRNLESFITIKPRVVQKSKFDTIRRTKTNKYKRKPPPQPIEINSADSTVWRSLPGIGPVYSKRIINFRTKLGGFFNIQQVGKCYGLPDSVFVSIVPYLTIDKSKIVKQNINVLDKKSFAAHPYIDWRAAKVILNYREMHGDFQDINKLYDLHGIEKSLIDTIVIYFDVK